MIEGVLLPSGDRSATTASAEQQNVNAARGVILFLDVTTGAGGETLTLQVEMKSPNSGEWEPLTAFAATAAGYTGEKVYVMYPGAIETAAIADQEVAGIPIPFRWRANVTHSAGGTWAYSLGYAMVQ